jgi:hypothetical protein
MTHKKKIETLKQLKSLWRRFEEKERWNTMFEMLKGQMMDNEEGKQWLKERCFKYYKNGW